MKIQIEEEIEEEEERVIERERGVAEYGVESKDESGVTPTKCDAGLIILGDPRISVNDPRGEYTIGCDSIPVPPRGE